MNTRKTTKVVAVLIAALMITACSSEQRYETQVVNVRGHEYVMANTTFMSNGAVSIVHAAHCPCINKPNGVTP